MLLRPGDSIAALDQIVGFLLDEYRVAARGEILRCRPWRDPRIRHREGSGGRIDPRGLTPAARLHAAADRSSRCSPRPLSVA